MTLQPFFFFSFVLLVEDLGSNMGESKEKEKKDNHFCTHLDSIIQLFFFLFFSVPSICFRFDDYGYHLVLVIGLSRSTGQTG